jgi:hypothetical protein
MYWIANWMRSLGMHVYLREEPVELSMLQVDAEGLAPDGSELVPIAFYVRGQDHPSFRALLPPDTIDVLREALDEPVMLGVLAEEPEDPAAEIRAMVGLTVPVSELGDDDDEPGIGDAPDEPWRESVGDPDAWRGQEVDVPGEEESSRTALLAFAPLVRVRRKFPDDFGEELADLLETALSGVTRPALEARVDRLLDDL